MLLLSTFPLYINGYSYDLIYPMLIIPFGPQASIIYAVAICLLCIEIMVGVFTLCLVRSANFTLLQHSPIF